MASPPFPFNLTTLDAFEERYLRPAMDAAVKRFADYIDQQMASAMDPPFVRIKGKAKITKIGMIQTWESAPPMNPDGLIAVPTLYIIGSDWEFIHDCDPPKSMGGYTGEELALIAEQWAGKI